jgi:hypothetical protein
MISYVNWACSWSSTCGLSSALPVTCTSPHFNFCGCPPLTAQGWSSHAGGKVYAHCAKGRHRGVAMGAAILIAQGYDPDTAMNLIKLQRPSADPDLFYIRSRILRFAQAWSRE